MRYYSSNTSTHASATAVPYVSRQKQTYMNMLYLFVSFPLGICYFPLLLIGIIVTVLNLIIIAIPLMILVSAGCWHLATFERSLAMQWLQIDIPPMSIPLPPYSTRWQRFRAHISNSVTWKSLLYLFLRFPFGIIAFVVLINVLVLLLVIGSITFTTGLLIAPCVYFYMLFVGKELDTKAVKRYLWLSFACYGVTFLPFYVSNGVAWMWGQFARSMLGMSDSTLRLAQAQAQLEQERARAEQADQKRRDLIVNVSHELRTPVASIRGHIDSLLLACDESDSGAPPPASLRKYLDIVQRESIRLGTLVEDLLALARTEKSELQVNMTVLQAGEVVEEVYQTLMPLARLERQITLVRQIAPGLPMAMADRERLTQVLLNLVRNAITYTPDGGIVSIALQQADKDHLALTVSDTGIGIPAEDLGRIFDRFYRTDASRSRSSGGFGLGLAIVRDFVIAMGGSITVESVVDEGSCFHVLLCVA